MACPYGRWQSVLLDRQSLIVAYDSRRGEPRGRGKERAAGAGDCIDCGACVITCPTGIDIRDGLQMECIHCTQCADACDAIMARVGRPPGLIRYSSRAALEGERERRLRPRVVLYPAALSLAFGGFLVALVLRTPADITVMRGMGAPFAVESDGRVANQLRMKITNRDPRPHQYTVSLDGVEPGTMIAPQNPIEVAPGRTEIMDLFVMLPAAAFHDGERRITVHTTDGAGYTDDVSYRLVGPEHHDGDESHGQSGAGAAAMKRGAWWPIAIATILALTVGANFWVYVVANADRGIAIEPDYYRKAVAWDSSMAQARENLLLGWRVTPSLAAFSARDGADLRVTLADSSGTSIPDATVRVSAFYNARAGEVSDVMLVPRSGGYETRLPVHHGGLWELRFDVRRGSLHFTATSRVEAQPAAGS